MERGPKLPGPAFHVLAMRLLLTTLLALLLCGPAGAEITRSVAVESLAHLKRYHRIPDFRLGGRYELGRPEAFENGGQGGVTLESLGQQPLRTAYMAIGTPRRDADGAITNAIVVNSYYSGDASNMYFFWVEGQRGVAFSEGPVVGPGRLIDTNRHYVVFLDSIGLWGASKPSDGLGLDFPDYSYFDIVQANYRLLRDELNIKRIRLTTGVSMGGALAYVWAILHPQFVDAIMPIAGNAYPDNIAHWTFQLMTAAVKSDPIWQRTRGRYYHLPPDSHPRQGLMFAWSILEHGALDYSARAWQPWEEVRKYVFYWRPEGDEGAQLLSRGRDFDANDILIRNRTAFAYDVREHLPSIGVPTLILHASNDQWVIHSETARLAATIPGARLLSYEHPLSHYSCFRAPNLLRGEVMPFLVGLGLGPGTAGREPRMTEEQRRMLDQLPF